MFAAMLVAMVAWALCCQPQGPAQSAPGWAGATAHAGQLSPQARVVVLDIATGRVLAANHLADSARTLAAPGSTLKPLALYGLIAAGRWDPTSSFRWRKRLAISRR